MSIRKPSHGTWLAIAIGALLTAACAVRAPASEMTIEACSAAETCRLSGLLTMSSDGHGFIGELEVADGKCVNVSLPVDVSKELINQPPQRMSVKGRPIGFPSGLDISHFTVDRRRVGFGSCGDFFVFVE